MESGRIAKLVDDACRCNKQQALLRARIAGGCSSGSCRGGLQPVGQQQVAQSSDYLDKKVAACTGYTSPYVCTPSSVRTLSLQLCATEAYKDPFNPEQRFSEYRRPYFPPPCPPIPQEALNANVPKMQMKRCPLPNKPDNPVLPG